VTGEISLFLQRFDGYIFENPTGDFEDDLPVFVFSQRDATFRGAEGHADIELLHRDPDHLVLELTADYVRASLSGGGSLPFIPPLRYGAGLRYQGQSLYALGEIRRTNAQNRVADFETTTAGYTLLNAAVGYRFIVAETVHDLMLRGNNLTDELAFNHLNPLKEVVPLAGRDFTLSYRVTF
jgi:iron complex outermembrane receptor protein